LDLISELDDQDSLRQLILKEKGLLSDIKQIHALLRQEEQLYQNEIHEKQLNVQSRKEILEKGRSDAEVQIRNLREQLNAGLGTNKGLQEQKINDLEVKIEQVKEKRTVETQVFGKIASFLREKENELKEVIRHWNDQLEGKRTSKQEEIDKLNEIKAKRQEDLRKLKEEYDIRNGHRMEKEKTQLERDEAKRVRLDGEERLDEAVKKIQETFRVWKAAGGVVKKKKKGGKKKSKK